jgi:non-canonical poly(A) RNA polymerase PAPD5/7
VNYYFSSIRQTINHRRLVREVYDKRVLHNILGVKPRAEVVVQEQSEPRHDYEPQKRPRSLRSPPPKERYSVWKDLEGRDTGVYQELRDASNRNDHDPEDPEESGKYDIGMQPPRKRRRRDNEKDKHTVFVADDDDASASESESTDEAEANAYAFNGEATLGKKSSSDREERRRNYWLSKAIGLGEDVSDLG